MNLLEEYGYKVADIEAKIAQVWDAVFSPDSADRLYFAADRGSAYLLDSRENAVTTESMAYGMMLAVQRDRQDVFDSLWLWTCAHMAITEGEYEGYFYWQCATDGSPVHKVPRPDALEYFAVELFFASHRWGNTSGICNYSQHAHALLRTALHSQTPTWNPKNRLIRNEFTSVGSDTSYNTPHFYEIFAMIGDVRDSDFWNAAADASREFIWLASNKKTGLSAEYTGFNGLPASKGEHASFFNHSYMTVINIALYALWFGDSPDLSLLAEHMLQFFDGKQPGDFMDYAIDGTPKERKAQHPVALAAALATCALTLERRKKDPSKASMEMAARSVRRFWEAPLPTGKDRYYDVMLYAFALLALSGNYKVY